MFWVRLFLIQGICSFANLIFISFWTKYLSEKDDLKNEKFNKIFDLQNEKLVGSKNAIDFLNLSF